MRCRFFAVSLMIIVTGLVAADEWQALDPQITPAPRYGHSMVTLADGVYLFGGFLANGISDELWRWDHDAGVWQQIPRSGAWPAARAYHGAVEWEGDLIVMGGAGDTGNSYDDVWRYTPGGGWTELSLSKLLVLRRDWAGVFALFGFAILIVGGFVNGGLFGDILRIVPLAGRYSAHFLATGTSLLGYYGMVLMGLWYGILVLLAILVPGKTGPLDYPVYAFGGADLAPSYSDQLFRIDPSTGVVEVVDVAGQRPSARIWPANAGWGETTFLFGGEGEGANRLGDAWLFDVATESFDRASDLPMAVSDAAAAVIPAEGPGNRVQVLVFGGLAGVFEAQQQTWVYTSDVQYSPQPTPDVAIAAAARARGLGVFFVSRFSLYNAGASALEMELTFTPRGGSAADQLVATHSVAAGRLEELEDPLAALFGVVDDAVGSVLIEVTAGDPADLIVHSVIIARQDDGKEYNQFFPAVAYADGLTAGTSATLFTTENPGRNRVNFGLTALDDGTEVTVTPQQPLGRVLAAPRTFVLDRGGNAQINNVHRAFGLGGMADVLLRMEIVNGRATGYVSVLDGTGSDYAGTSDPTTIQPLLAGNPALLLLEIGPVQGLNEFAGSGSILNFAAADADVRVDFYKRGVAGISATGQVVIPAGTAVGYDDLVSQLVGLPDAVGTVVLASTNGRRLGAIGREFAIERDGGGAISGTAGQPMPGMTPADRLQPGQTAHFIGLRQVTGGEGPERSHVAFFNQNQASLGYSAAVYGAGGRLEGTVEGDLAGEALIQVNNIIREANPAFNGEVKRLEVTVDRPAYVLAFRVNPTGDPITIPPVVRPTR